MTISTAQYIDLLFKKLSGVAKTATATQKSPSNESIASPPLLRGDIVWCQSDQIPGTAQVVSGITLGYLTTSRIECTPDTTVPPIGGIYPTWLTNLTNWIPQEFGSTWPVKVYVDTAGASNPSVSGTEIFSPGVGGVGEFFFDTQAGLLNFIGETIPATLTAGKNIFIVGYRYVGLLGVTHLPSGTSIGNLSISGNTIVSINTDGDIVLNPNGAGRVVIDSSFVMSNASSTVDFTTTANVTLGSVANLHISGGTPSYVLSTDGSGNLSWVAQGAGNGASNIANGTSNVFIATSGGNVTTSVGGVANVVVVTTTGANIAGYANVTGNITAGNMSATTFTGNLTGLASSATVAASANAVAGANVSGFVANAVYANLATFATTSNSVAGANVSGAVSYATTANSVAGANVSGFVANADYANLATFATTANAVAGANVSGFVANATYANLATFATTANAVAGANVSGAVSSATTAGTVTTNAQPNITSTGTLTSVTVSGIASFSANVNMNSQNINNLLDPVNNQDAATKYYVDLVAQGLHIHTSAYVATTGTLAVATGGTVTYNNGASGVGANLVTTGTYLLIDGGNVQTVGTRILVKNEANSVWNGVYTYANTTTIVRATDFDNPADVQGGDFLFVTSGSTLADTSWVQTTDAPIVFGTSPLVFAQFSGAGTYQAGTGLTLTDNIFSVNASQTQITAVGTLSNLSVTGNITSGNASLGNLVTANFFSGSGNNLSNIQGANVSGAIGLATYATTANAVAGANVSGAVSYATTANAVAGANVSGFVANATYANLATYATTANAVAGANVSGFVANAVYANLATFATTANAVAGANVSGTVSSATTAATVTTAAQPNITSTGTLTSLTVTGNLQAGNITATSNITGNYIFGNGHYLTGVDTTPDNISNGNSSVTINTAGGNVVTSVNGNAGILIVTDTGANFAGYATATGNITAPYFIGNGYYLTGVDTSPANISNGNSNVNIPFANGNVTISSAGNANILTVTGTGINIVGDITTGSGIGGNITSANVISANTFIAVANITSGNASLGNLVTANFFTGNGYLLTGIGGAGYIFNGTSNVNIATSGGNVTTSVGGNANILVITGTGANIAGYATVTGNITSGNASLGNLATANFFTGSGNLLSNIQGANVTGAVGLATYATTANAVAGANVSGQVANALISGTVYTNAQPNITSTGTLTSLVVTGNITSGNANLGNLVTANFFTGSGNNLSNIQGANVSGFVSNADYANLATFATTANAVAGANVSGQVANALISGTVYTNAQPNITSVGTLTTLVVTGNITAGNANLGNAATANFFIGNGYLLTGVGNATAIVNGNSNVSIDTANGNITFSAVGNANIVTITGTGANIVGTANITGNVALSGPNVTLGSVSNLHIAGGTANYVLTTDGAGSLSWAAQGGVSAANVTVDNFTGNGVQTVFTLSTTPIGINQTSVNYNGATVLRSAYTLAGANITFSSAPANSSLIEITTINLTSGGSGGNGTPGGSNTQVQYNNDGNFAGSSSLTFNSSTSTLSATLVTGTLTTNAQPNITSVGTLTGLAINGNLSVNNVGVTGNIVPSSNNIYSLGNASFYWKDAYIGPGSLYINGSKVLEESSNAIVVSADVNQTVRVTASGTGDVQLQTTGTGVIAVKGPLQIQAANYITSSNGGPIGFSNPINVDTISSLSANTNLIITANGTGIVQFNDDITVAGNLTINGGAGNLSVTSLTVEDNIIDISAETTGTPTNNAGIRVIRGDDPAVQLRWNETSDTWQYTNDGTTYLNIVGSNTTSGNISAGNVSATTFTGALTGLASSATVAASANSVAGANVSGTVATATTAGTVTTAAQGNITSIGTLTSVSVSGNANVGNLGTAALIATGTGSFGGNVNLNSFNIISLATPVNDTDAATKAYVDTVAQGLDTKASVVAATTANITLSGTQTIDGVAVTAGQRVLVKNQTAPAENGLYLCAAGSWTRTTDMDNWTEVPGAYVFVEGGTTQADTGWVCTSNAGGTIDVTAMTWAQFSGAGSYTAGTGLTLTGSVFSVNVAQTQITSVGTLTSLSVSGNITAGNVSATTFTGELTGLASSATVAASANSVAGANVSGQVANALISGTVYTNAQPNITSTGTLTSLVVTGNITSGNANLGNLVTANFFTGNGYLLTGVGNATAIVNGNSNVSIPTANGNVTISAAGNNIMTITGTGANIAGTANVTGTLTAGNIVTTGTGGNISGANVISANTFIATANITAGNANLGNLATANFFTGSGNLLSNIQGANVSGFVSNATYANLATYATTANAVEGANVSGFVANAIYANAAGTIANGNSNVNISTANGNIVMSAVGNNIMSITGTGANILGYANITGNVTLSGANISLGPVANLKISGGTSTYVLSTDGSSNLSWVAQSSGSSLTIQGEGSNLTTTANTINFAGAGVIATNVSNVVTVTIPGGGITAQDLLSPFLLMGA